MAITKPKLIGIMLCPFVQKVIITLHEKNIDFDIAYIDYTNKPQWFLNASPLGKVPLLLINEHAIFESTVVAEFLDEQYSPQLHPTDPYQKAMNRSWMEFASPLLFAVRTMSIAPDEQSYTVTKEDIVARLAQLESQLQQQPFFNGNDFSLIDATYAPLFMRISKLEEIYPLGLLDHFPKLKTWSKTLLQHPSVQASEYENYLEKLKGLLEKNNSYFYRFSQN